MGSPKNISTGNNKAHLRNKSTDQADFILI